MKNSFNPKIWLLMPFFLMACSKDDDADSTPQEPLSERVEYLFTGTTNFPGGEEYLTIDLPVDIDAKIIDPSKVTVEIRLQHNHAGIVDYGYVTPDGTSKYLVVNLGGNNEYNGNNTLTFNAAHTTIIGNSYPDDTVPEGNYAGGSYDNNQFPVESPLFNSLLNKNTQGTWQFFFSDFDEDDDSGQVYWIKLIFEEGALEVNDN